jgi:hypothetical protein
MMEPPAILDSSQMLMYATLDESVKFTGRAVVMVGGKVIDPVPRLAICRNLYDDDILLFHCDKDWNVLGAGGYGTVEDAQAHAESTYAGSNTKWHKFRALTAEELSQIDEARRFVRDPSIPEFKE